MVPQNEKQTKRPEGIRAWDSLDADQKKVDSHMTAVYAGALSHCDYQIGRVVDTVKEMGALDNTLVIDIQGDNGASAEGNPNGLLNEMSFFNNIKEEFSEVVENHRVRNIVALLLGPAYIQKRCICP